MHKLLCISQRNDGDGYVLPSAQKHPLCRVVTGFVVTLFTVLIWQIFLPAHATAAGKSFNHRIDQPFAGSQSPDDAFMAAMTRAKFEVLELAGTYLESLSVVENAILTKDEVTSLAGGVLSTEVTSRENYATEKTFGMLLEIRIEVDTDMLRQRMDALTHDRSLLRKYNEIQEREQELLARIRQLEMLNQNLATNSPQQKSFSNEFAQISAALTASQWLEKAIALWHDGRFSDPQQAIGFLDKAINLDEKNPRTFNSRAIAFLNLGKFQEAEADLRKALTLNSSFADAHNNLGSLHYRRGNYPAAINSYTKALEHQPDFIEAVLNRGMASRKLFKFAEAFEDFKKAMDLAPQSANTDADAASLVEINDLDQLCSKAQTACRMSLCRSLDFLRQRGFCLKDVKKP